MKKDTLHYFKFDRKTGKSELIIKEYPLGTFKSRASKFVPKTKQRTNKIRANRLKNLRAKCSRMYNFLFK